MHVTLDYTRELLTVQVKGVDPGTFADGPQAVRIALQVDTAAGRAPVGSAPPLDALIDARPGIRSAMTKLSAWPLLLLPVTVLGACSTAKPNPASRLEWRKSSDFAPPLKEARQNCSVQAAAETIGTPGKAAVIDADFVKCMRAVGWALVDHGAE